MLEDGTSNRGIIKDIIFIEDIEGRNVMYIYLPINHQDLEANRTKLFRKDLIRYIYPFYLRFKPGDYVLIYHEDYWVPALVVEIYPPGLYLSGKGVPPYRVKRIKIYDDRSDRFLSVSSDTDTFIQKRINHLRFKMHEDVLISRVYCLGTSYN